MEKLNEKSPILDINNNTKCNTHIMALVRILIFLL